MELQTDGNRRGREEKETKFDEKKDECCIISWKATAIGIARELRLYQTDVG